MNNDTIYGLITGLVLITLVLAYTVKSDSNLKYYTDNCTSDHQLKKFINCN